jgi:UDP-2,3-diacylglucosamine pyrophosphatase LpxH
VRSAPVKFLFRILPWFIAGRLVTRISTKSQADCKRKAPREFAPDLDYAYQRLMTNDCQTLICGHTHRPEVSDLGEGRRLIVLPPWCETQAGYLARGAELVRVQVDRAGRWSPA